MWRLRPTARGWVLGIGSGLWFVVAVVNHNILASLFACGGLALTCASLLLSLLCLWGITVRRGPIGDAATGQAVSMPVVLRNTLSRRRQSLVVREMVPFALDQVHEAPVLGLLAGEERVVPRRVLAMARGEFCLDRVLLRSGDPAGLFCCDRTVSLPRTVLVLPGVVPLPDLHLRRRHAVATPTGTPMSGAGTSQEFYGVREYNPSDGLRHIHWKSSARWGRLMVREFERHAIMSVGLLLDAQERNVSGTEHWSNLEYLVRAAASVARHVAGLYCQIGFGVGGEREILIAPGPASSLEWDILYQLAVLQPGGVSVADVALRLGERLPPETVVYCFSLSTPARLAQALGVLGDQGMTVRWFCAAPESFGGPDGRGREVPAVARAESRGVVEVVQLHPGLPLDRVMTHAV